MNNYHYRAISIINEDQYCEGWVYGNLIQYPYDECEKNISYIGVPNDFSISPKTIAVNPLTICKELDVSQYLYQCPNLPKTIYEYDIIRILNNGVFTYGIIVFKNFAWKIIFDRTYRDFNGNPIEKYLYDVINDPMYRSISIFSNIFEKRKWLKKHFDKETRYIISKYTKWNHSNNESYWPLKTYYKNNINDAEKEDTSFNLTSTYDVVYIPQQELANFKESKEYKKFTEFVNF